MRVTLLDYGMGNLRSVQRALEAAGAEVARAEHPGDGPLVLPGVGAFAEAVRRLRAGGAWDEVRETVARGRPVLGICLGMQLLFEGSDEHGDNAGLGLFPGRVERLGAAATVPNMGWHALDGLGGPFVYLAHSYGVRAPAPAPPWVLATLEHGERWVAAVRRDNLTGFQFHPEKSGAGGVALLGEWLRWA